MDHAALCSVVNDLIGSVQQLTKIADDLHQRIKVIEREVNKNNDDIRAIKNNSNIRYY